jgi:hypothetical protein
MEIDIDAARRELAYDPETGVFVWRVSKRGPVRAGDRAGTIGPEGYRAIKVNQRKYRASRLAWAMHYGEQPADEVDHENGIRDDDRIKNLRPATRGQNAENVVGLGVRFEAKRRKWLARICVDRRQINLGRFDTEAEALAATRAAKVLLRGPYARL